MIRELRIYWALRGEIGKLKEIASMKFSWTAFFLFLGVIAEALNKIGGLAPPKAQPYVSIATYVIMALSGLKAFWVNPDGTSAKVAYQPEAKK